MFEHTLNGAVEFGVSYETLLRRLDLAFPLREEVDFIERSFSAQTDSYDTWLRARRPCEGLATHLDGGAPASSSTSTSSSSSSSDAGDKNSGDGAPAGPGGPRPLPSYNGTAARTHEWQILHYGQALNARLNEQPSRRRDGMPPVQATKRRVVSAGVRGDVDVFLGRLGYVPKFEFVRRGLRFSQAGLEADARAEVLVTRVFKLKERGNPSTAVPIVEGSYHVELRVFSGEEFAGAGENEVISAWRDRFTDLVNFEKPDRLAMNRRRAREAQLAAEKKEEEKRRKLAEEEEERKRPLTLLELQMKNLREKELAQEKLENLERQQQKQRY